MNIPAKGLTAAEVAQRVAAGKVNQTHERTSRSVTDILRANVFTRFNALLTALTIVILIVGSPLDALLGLVIVINSAIGIVQELRAKFVLDKLALVNAPTARVLRDETLQELPITEVVLDDVLKLSAGDQVPADAVVLAGEGLEIDESLLTGESDPIVKHAGAQVLSGSIVIAGVGYAKTTAVGVDAYAHKIAAQAKKFTIARSELVEGTNKLLGYISLIVVIVAPLLVWGQIANSGNSLQQAVLRSAAALDGMIPNGLVLLTSLAFMLATLSLARRNVLVQQLPAVEGLARVDVMCLDKTGTLTEGVIAFRELLLLDKTSQKTAEHVLAAFGAEPNSPTLQALHMAFDEKVVARLTVPFSSARKWSALHMRDEHWVMGAPEIVAQGDKKVLAQSQDYADRGMRVLVLLCSKTMPTPTHLPVNMQPVALVVLGEKIRSDAKKTLGYFAEQGVALKVISGDSPNTVAAIARAVGLEVAEPIDARTLPQDMHKLATLLETHNVFGRVTPDQKRAMIKALQSKGHVVAMTGDGVNDALALKDADIGIAMASGAKATKAIAELVLLDNSFATMPHVLAEGRRVIANIERVANLFLIKNVYALCLALAVTVVALPFPFLPRHLTILSTLAVGVPAFLLSLAPNNQRYVPGFLKRVLQFAVPVGVVTAGLIFAGYYTIMSGNGSPALAGTIASIIAMSVGTWVLVCLARPFTAWKAALIVLLDGTFIALLIAPAARQILQYELRFPDVWWACALSVLGVLGVELLWRRSKKIV